MIPELRLMRAIFSQAVYDSLMPPPTPLPDYPTTGSKTKEWVRIRDKRRRIISRRNTRDEARDYLLDEDLDALYSLCHGTTLAELRKELIPMWDDVDRDPGMSKVYHKRFNGVAGHNKGGGR